LPASSLILWCAKLSWPQLSEAEQSDLIRQISDLESGHPRQWYWLEIAQTLAGAQRSRRTRLIGIALNLFGTKACSPILIKTKIKGGELYQQTAAQLVAFGRHKINDALLFAGSLLSIMVGFGLLPASLQFAAWCLAIGGALWHMARQIKTRPSQALQINPDTAPELPGAESSLGLPAILLASGLSSPLALSLVKGIKQDPATFIEPLLLNYPALRPEPEAELWIKLSITSTGWLGLGLINSWLIGLLPTHWGTLCAMLLMLAIAMWINTKKQALVILGTWLGVFLLASLAHYL
jgi:hypothetical protein